MSEVVTTKVEFANIDFVANLAGDLDPETVRDMLSENYTFLENAVYTTSFDEVTGEKTLLFSEKLGSKGISL